MPLTNTSILRVRICSYTQSQVGLNITHWIVQDVIGAPLTEQEAASLLVLRWHSEYKSVLSSSARWRGVGVSHYRSLPVGAEFSDVSLDGPGTAPGNMLASQTSGIISLRTALAGRSNRGRMYIPFPAASDGDINGAPTASYVVGLTALASVLGPFIPLVVAGRSCNIIQVIRHRSTILPPLPESFSNVASWRPVRKFATQRRRGQYGAQNTPIF